MRSLIVDKILDKKRNSKAEAEGISEFKDKIEIGKTIHFNWWSFYGRGSNVKRSWVIEFHEIEDIY